MVAWQANFNLRAAWRQFAPADQSSRPAFQIPKEAKNPLGASIIPIFPPHYNAGLHFSKPVTYGFHYRRIARLGLWEELKIQTTRRPSSAHYAASARFCRISLNPISFGKAPYFRSVSLHDGSTLSPRHPGRNLSKLSHMPRRWR